MATPEKVVDSNPHGVLNSCAIIDAKGVEGCTGTERQMAEIIEYGEATDVWVDDGHVFVARADGVTVRMAPEVAIAIGRKLEAAGTESFINKVMDGHASSDEFPRQRE